jgi:type II secretion system protein N
MAEAAEETTATGRHFSVREKLLHGAMYLAFFSLVFTIALYWTFPYDRVRDYVAYRLSEATGGTVEIDSLEPAGLSGVEVHDVLYTPRAQTPDAAPIQLRLDDLRAKLSLFGLLFGRRTLSVDAHVDSGSLEGTLQQSGDARELSLNLSQIDLGRMGVGGFLGLPIKGKGTGTIELHVPKDEVAKITGDVDLDVLGLHIGDGKAKLKLPGMANGFTLDELNAGKLRLASKIQAGVANLTRCSSDGSDLKLIGKGNIKLADPFGRSRPELDLELKFSPEYKQKSDRTKAMFDLISFNPELRRATAPDGTLRVHVGGTFLALRTTATR